MKLNITFSTHQQTRSWCRLQQLVDEISVPGYIQMVWATMSLHSRNTSSWTGTLNLAYIRWLATTHVISWKSDGGNREILYTYGYKGHRYTNFKNLRSRHKQTPLWPVTSWRPFWNGLKWNVCSSRDGGWPTWQANKMYLWSIYLLFI